MIRPFLIVCRVSIPLRGRGKCNNVFLRLWMLLRDVSVPLRGRGKCNIRRGDPPLWSPGPCPRSVSVPLRGRGKCNPNKPIDEPRIPGGPIVFPSPCGEEVSVTIPPLSCGLLKFLSDVSVPLRGRGKCNTTNGLYLDLRTLRRFRPLAGKR